MAIFFMGYRSLNPTDLSFKQAYLGIKLKLENNLQWNKNTTYITNKAPSRLGYILSVIHETEDLLALSDLF